VLNLSSKRDSETNSMIRNLKKQLRPKNVLRPRREYVFVRSCRQPESTKSDLRLLNKKKRRKWKRNSNAS